jgi:hypothetical protein
MGKGLARLQWLWVWVIGSNGYNPFFDKLSGLQLIAVGMPLPVH